ncbi:hypothetical protein LTR95_018206 [Oleoguttula sp. CCFEE 5521]
MPPNYQGLFRFNGAWDWVLIVTDYYLDRAGITLNRLQQHIYNKFQDRNGEGQYMRVGNDID